MKKFATLLLAAGLALSSGAVFAEGTDAGSNNGNANQTGGPGSVQKLAPNGVDNNKINTSNTNTAQEKHHKKTTQMHKKTSKNADHKITMCKDGRCPNQTPGTKQSKATGN
ncbi:hypothetical protein GA565_18945 [Rouxiella sp. S1S-2]|uniref:protein YbgS n=1 Tax=Rouxiella sp. S1S-2 TaxID=2653856 RepID=UPI0012658EFC|nr:protein YbgS [Rouxiella sp. S1S-2]KAB7897893.1 hypothetical protein GA565_18945 [Rouxiella sp. S1S-2]